MNNWQVPMLQQNQSLYGKYGLDNNLGVFNQQYEAPKEKDKFNWQSVAQLPSFALSAIANNSFNWKNSANTALTNFNRQNTPYEQNKDLYSTQQDFYGVPYAAQGGSLEDLQAQYKKAQSLATVANLSDDSDFSKFASSRVDNLYREVQSLEQKAHDEALKDEIMSSLPKQSQQQDESYEPYQRMQVQPFDENGYDINNEQPSYQPSYTPQTTSNKNSKGNGSFAFNYLQKQGLAPHQAAGIVGNFTQESNVNPSITNSIGAFGIGQWLGPRKKALINFAKSKGKPANDLQTQLDFTLYELNGSERGAYNALKKARNSTEAAQIVRRKYERPGESEANDQRRIQAALKLHPYKQGGQLPMYGAGGQNRPTTSDSLQLYNNAIAKDKYYKNNPNYSKVPLNTNDFNRQIPDLFDDFFTPYYAKNLNDNAKVIYENGTPYRNHTLPKTAGSKEPRFYPINKDLISVGDIGGGGLSPYYPNDAPNILLHRNIKPQGWNGYRSTKTGDASNIPYYDPIAIKPANMKTPADWAYVNKKYGTKIPQAPVKYQPQQKIQTVTKPQQTINTTKGKVTGTVKPNQVKGSQLVNVTQQINKPTHPVNNMKRLSMSNQDLDTPNIQIQGQPISLPEMRLPQQGNIPFYGPGNTIVGYTDDNRQFYPAQQYTGAQNNQSNLQDRELLNNPEMLQKYVQSKDTYKFQKGGIYQQQKPIIDNNDNKFIRKENKPLTYEEQRRFRDLVNNKKATAYRPSPMTLKSKAAIAPLSYSPNPFMRAIGTGLSSGADLATSINYLADGQYGKAGEDFGQALLNLIPGSRFAGYGIKGDKTYKAIKGLKTLKGMSDIKTVSEAFKQGGIYK